ncbi:MAG TPA: translocation/assembly module TamB domain-containing protein [Lentimicrobium sp.]|nr:translocation/assembly module TamB domain-containing protein [Lentimicrobium sp.]
MYLIFRSPAVQTRLAQYSAALFSKELKTKVTVGSVDITWFFDLVIKDVKLYDQRNKILFAVDAIKLDFQKINLKNHYAGFKEITLEKAEINLIKYKNDSTFNYGFLIDHFNSTPDTLVKTEEALPWSFNVSNITLKNSSLVYSNEHKPYYYTSMDYDHLKISDINLKLNSLSLRGDSTVAHISSLSAREKSGFILYQFTSGLVFKSNEIRAKGLHISTPGADLQLDLKFAFNHLSDFNHFIDSVKMDASFRPSMLDINEIRYFAKEVKGMEDLINFEGNVKGTVSSLKARAFKFSTGESTSFFGEINMDGLPDIEDTFIHLNVKNLTTDYYDISNIQLPANEKPIIPEELKNLGLIDVKGFFTGFINDFVSSADFNTAIGKLGTDISLKTSRGKSLKYNGAFNLTNWDLGKTFDISDKAGIISLNSRVNGEVLNKKNNNVNMDAQIQKVLLLGNEFNDIKINGTLVNRHFNGELLMNDELANLDFKGIVDFSDTVPEMNFTASLKDAYLSKLNIWDRDTSSRISTTMDLNFKGSNIDNLLGYLRFDSTYYSEGSKTFFVNKIELATTEIGRDTKKLSLQSDLVDASFYGVFSFGDFYVSLSEIINAYLPSLNLKLKSSSKVNVDQLFDYTVQLKNVEPLTSIFLPAFSLKSEASLFGSYNSKNKTIILNGLADEFQYNDMKFSDWYIRGKNLGNSLQIYTGVHQIQFNSSETNVERKLGIENFTFKTFMQGDSIKYDVAWNDEAQVDRNKGHIDGYLSFNSPPYIKGRFNDFNLLINNKPWIAHQENDIIIDSTSISIDKISIQSNEQKLALSGVISENPADSLSLNFDKLDISNADILIGVKGVDFDGILTGGVTIKDLYKSQQLEAQVEVKDFAFNKERMGDAVIRSNWLQDISALDIQADIIYKGNAGTHLPVSAKGLIYTANRPEGNFDMDVKVINYKLASLNPFLRGIASNIKGFANGNLKLEGTFRDPVITGELDLLRTQMKVDYLNVTYSFANKVKIEPDLIVAKGVTIYDSLGNTGNLDFEIRHDHFRKIMLNMDITAKNLSSLNTTYKQNNLFYGKAFGSGKVNISGSLEDISINIDASSDANTMVYIPINLAVGASEKNFIRFKAAAVDGKRPVEEYIPDQTGVDVFMNLLVKKNAVMQLFLPENIGNIKGNGTGIIQMGINKQGDMSIYGDYKLEQGNFLFTLGNIINRSFNIQPGSTISFNGSPYDANINLSAVYKLKASIKELTNPPVSRSIPVDCIIMLKNDLYNPDISFSIRLPQADDEINQTVYSTIDTTNQIVMTQQIVSLLVLKRFAVNAPQNFASSVGSSSIDVLTDQLSNMLSQIIKDVDIGVKYRTGDELTQEEVEVALSTNLFNDRVSIDGNVGMYTQGTTEGANSIVGDVEVDVKITPDGRFRVKAFNRSNQYDMLVNDLNTYKQGIGVYYRYEFDRFSDIFTRKKKKVKKD